MDPKSRDSQDRAASAGRAFFAALLALSFTTGCDATETADEDEREGESEQASDAAAASDAGTTEASAARLLRRATPGSLWTPAQATRALGSRPSIDGLGSPIGAGTADDAADDDTTADEVDDDASDDAACANGDVTAPVATGRIVTLAAEATGFEPISPADCVEVVDDCDAAPIVELLWAQSDEPESGVAVDDRVPDVSDLGCGLGVRAERAENGDGRVYTIGWRATDRGGNATQGTCTVRVEKVPGEMPLDSGSSYEVDTRGLGCSES